MSGKKPLILAKGSNFTGLLRTAERLRGDNVRSEILQELPKEIASAILYGQIVAVGWYPVEWYAELHAAIGRTLKGGPELARSLGREATLADFKSLHRLVVAVLTVETVFAQAHRMMNLYWKGGTIERVQVGRGRGRLLFSGWPGFSRLIWEDIVGGVEAIMSLCQATHVHCRPLGALEKADTIELEVRWS
jgi:hypothetical protein